MKRAKLVKLAGALGLTAVLYLAVEGLVLLFYDPALDLYPGFSENVARMNHALYVFDPELIRKMPPGLDTVHPESKTPMRTNEHGFRGPPFEWEKPAGIELFRIVFLGDSCTYGFGLEEPQSLPRRVETLLRKNWGDSAPKIEAVNLAVPGYTSFQGVRQARRHLARLSPDVVVIGFGFNDSTVRNTSEAEVQASIAKSGGLEKVARFLEFSPLFEMLRIKARKQGKTNIGAGSLVIAPGETAVSRVPLSEYRQNLVEMVDLAEAAGARVVLVNMNVANHFNVDAMKALAEARDLPFVDGRALLERGTPWAASPRRVENEGPRRFIVQTLAPGKGLAGMGDPFLMKLPLSEVRFPMAELPLVDDGTPWGSQGGGRGLFMYPRGSGPSGLRVRSGRGAR